MYFTSALDGTCSRDECALIAGARSAVESPVLGNRAGKSVARRRRASRDPRPLVENAVEKPFYSTC